MLPGYRSDSTFKQSSRAFFLFYLICLRTQMHNGGVKFKPLTMTHFVFVQIPLINDILVATLTVPRVVLR